MKNLIEDFINEINIERVQGIICAKGSTHIMKTCKIDDEEYYLKFSDSYNFFDFDPSLQILIEYIAYSIYSLYPGINIPKKIHLVYDSEKEEIGIATSKVSGVMALKDSSKEEIGRGLSAGVFVDVLLANWDVVGTGTGNVIKNKEQYTRIDPGGSLTFRAQGGRKSQFNDQAWELQTMLSKDYGGSGLYFQYSDLKKAAITFAKVPWSKIENKIKAAEAEIVNEIKTLRSQNPALFSKLESQFIKDIQYILQTLKARYAVISNQVLFVLK